jgi:hypothetical protein
MILHVKAAKYLRDYVLWVRFNDGMQGEVDLKDELEGEVFEPLKRLALFRTLRVDPVLQTVVWPNEADLAPEFLHDKMQPSACVNPAWADEAGSLVAREGHEAYETERLQKSGAMRTTGMNPRVAAAFPENGHRLRLRFRNGEERIYDCTPLLDLGVFRELANDAYFRQVRVCDGTVCWPHEQDICPDTLYMDSVSYIAAKSVREETETYGNRAGKTARDAPTGKKRAVTAKPSRKKS